MISIESLEALREAFEITKTRSQRALRRPYLRLVAAALPKMRRPVREFMDLQRKALLAELPSIGRIDRIGAHKPKKLAEEAFPWDEIMAEGKSLLKPTLLEILALGGQEITGRRLRKQEAEAVPHRFDPIGLEAVKWAEEHAAWLVTLITTETRGAIAEIIARGIDQGLSGYYIARDLRPLVGLTAPHVAAVGNYTTRLIEEGYSELDAFARAERYAQRLHNYRTEMITRTEASSATSEGIIQGYEQWGIEELDWVADPECCENCSAAAEESPYKIEDSHGLIPAHPHCIAGNSKVIIPEMKVCMSGSYHGPIYRIVTRFGSASITPNHMLLTPNGFAKALSLRKGDKIVYSTFFEREVFGNPNDHRKPATVEEIVTSLSESPRMAKRIMPVASEYLHGEGAFMNGNIDIVWPNGLLEGDIQSDFFKHIGEKNFASSYRGFFDLPCFSSFGPMLKTLALASDGIMGGRYNSHPIGRRLYPLPHKDPGLAIASSPDSHREDSSFDYRSADAERLRNALFCLSGEISSCNILDIKIVFHKHLRVYDFETSSSLYILNGLISSNCECAWTAH
jgi:hypothetical protein